MNPAERQLLPVIHRRVLESGLTGIAASVCIGLFLFHLSLIWKYAVDVPYLDEWASFDPTQLPSGLSLENLFAQHNEHRIMTTRLLVSLQFHLNGWNLATHQILNFAIYGLILLAIGWFAKGAAPQIASWLILGFIVFLLSPINWFNHFMGYQSHVHFWLLFSLVSAVFLFSDTQRWLDVVVGSAFAVLSICSDAAGFVSSFALLIMFALFKIIHIHSSAESRRAARGYFQVILVVGFLGSALLLWLLDYRKPPYHPALVLPHEWKFWSHFLNLVALGFGVDGVSNTLGAFCMLIILVPVVGVILINKRNLRVGQWRTLALMLGVLGVLASIAAGRAGFGVEQAKDSRYFEVGMMLIPLSLVSWTFLLQEKKLLRAGLIAGLWIFCFQTFWNNWKEFRQYKRVAIQRKAGLTCLTAYYQGDGDSNCSTLYPVPIPIHLLEGAKALNVSFYRRITNKSQTANSTSPSPRHRN